MNKKKMNYEITTGNIFEDLGLPNADDLLARSNLLSEVELLIKSSGLTQKQVAEKLGISQPKVSQLVSGKLSEFSSETLFKYLRLLGCDIQIKIKKPRSRSAIFRRRGRMAVR